MHDSLHPDRIVVGADDRGGGEGRRAVRRTARRWSSPTATPETIKYASNAFLATKLSFVNALAGLCEAVGADVRDVILGLGYDQRIGFEFLRPGPGWGGSCLPKDTRALLHIAEEAGYDFSFLAAPSRPTRNSSTRVVSKVAAAAAARSTAWRWRCGGSRSRRTPTTGATRQSRHQPPPGGAGARVQAFDPTVDADDGRRRERSRRTSRGLHLRPDPYDAATGATALVVLTEWDEFRWVDFSRVQAVMAEPTSSTPATSRTRPPSAAWASPTRGSGASEPGGGGRGRRLPRLASLRQLDRARGRCGVPRRPVDRVEGERGAPARARRLPPHRDEREREVELGDDDPVDAVCDLASPASPPAYLARPFDTLAVGSEGTRRLARARRAPRRALPAGLAPARSTAIPRCIPRPSPTGAT